MTVKHRTSANLVLHSCKRCVHWLCVQVLREVAVMDAINRGGSYSMRIRMLAPFADARKCE